MNDYYYTIIRKYEGLPDYLNTDLSEEDDCFCFDTEYEANKCLSLIFNNGNWMLDEKYGVVRYYGEQRKVNHRRCEF